MNIIKILYNALPLKEKISVRKQMEKHFQVKKRRIDLILHQEDGDYKIYDYLFMIGLVSAKIPTDIQRFAKHIGKEFLVTKKSRERQSPVHLNANQVAYTN